MSEPKNNEADPALRSLLRQSLKGPELPLRFQESVWQRLQRAESVEMMESPAPSWLDNCISLLLRPRIALAAILAAVVMGSVIGFYSADDAAREAARNGYIQKVNPFLGSPRL